MTHSFTVFCVPPKATSQMKGACAIKGGRGVRFFKKKNVAAAENTLMALFRPHVPAVPFKGPIKVTMVWSFPWRKSERKSNLALGAAPNDTRPDASNLVKMAEDVMTTLGFWGDDGQIADLTVRKQWADWSGIDITISDDPVVLIHTGRQP